MDLKDKIQQLTERYDDNKPKTLVDEQEQPKRIPPDYFVTLSFDKRNEFLQGILLDMEALGFKLVCETAHTLRYHTDLLKEEDAEALLKFMEKIKKASTSSFYDVAFDNIPDKTIHYEDVCKVGYSQVYSSKYMKGEQEKDISDHIKTEEYHKSLHDFESKLISPNFKNEFCDAVISTIKDSIDVAHVSTTFMTDDPIRSMVYETFDFTLKISRNAMMEFHSMHYPHMYQVDTAIGYSQDKARELKDILRDVRTNPYYEAINEIIGNRYLACDTMKPLKAYKEMKPFPKELDTEQTADDDFSVHYFLSTDHIERGYGSVKNEICRIVVKTALEYVQMNKAHEIHEKMLAVNAGRVEMADIMVDSFKDRVDVREWKTVIGNPVIAPSDIDAYLSKKTKKMKPN